MQKFCEGYRLLRQKQTAACEAAPLEFDHPAVRPDYPHCVRRFLRSNYGWAEVSLSWYKVIANKEQPCFWTWNSIARLFVIGLWRSCPLARLHQKVSAYPVYCTPLSCVRSFLIYRRGKNIPFYISAEKMLKIGRYY